MATNPNFLQDAGLEGWNYIGGSAPVITPQGTGVLFAGVSAIEHFSIFDTEKFYYLEITVAANDNNIDSMLLSGTGIAELFTPSIGQHTFFVRSAAGTFRLENIVGVGGILVSSFKIYEIQMPTVSIYDMQGEFIEDVTGAEYKPPLMNVAYTPSENVQALDCFQVYVEQDCDEEDNFQNSKYISEPIQIVQTKDELLYQVGGCMNRNNFYKSWSPYMRLNAKLISDQAPTYERFVTRKSNGRFRLDYGRMTKTKTLYTDYVPEHVRDFLYFLPMFDSIVIRLENGIQEQYFVENEADAPDFLPSSDTFARMVMPLVFKQELLESVYISECNVKLPPKALGSVSGLYAYEMGENTAIGVD